MDHERGNLTNESTRKRKKKGFVFDVFALTLIVCVICAISSLLRLIFNHPAILVPFNLYKSTHEIAPQFVQNHPDVTALNSVENRFEAFVLAVLTAGLIGNYWKRRLHYYSVFIFFMLISSLTCLIRLIYTIILYFLYPLDTIEEEESQRNRTFWFHIIGYVLSIFVYLLMIFIILKARKAVLDSKLKRLNMGIVTNLWRFWSAKHKREHWAANEPNQQTIEE